MPNRTLRPAAVLALAGALLAAGCGSDSTPAAPSSGASTSTTMGAMAGMDHGAGSGMTQMDHDIQHSIDDGMARASGHHHAESTVTYAKLPAATKAEVDQVIDAWAHKYATAADATKDGWVKATRSLYGIGSHYLKGGVSGFMSQTGTFDLLQPNVMLFDGEGPDAKFAGVSYILSGAIPEGFTGAYDVWHRHNAVCFVPAEMLVISEVEAEGSPINLGADQCKARSGVLFPISNLSMIHLWIGPGYLGRAPIFAHDHPELYDGYRPAEDKSGTAG